MNQIKWTDHLKRGVWDVLRFIGQWVSLFISGYSILKKSIHWTVIAPLLVFVSAAGFYALFTRKFTFRITSETDYSADGTLGLWGILYIGVIAVWFIASLVWAGIRFRVTPRLVFESVANDEDVRGELHYRVKIRNISRTQIEDCEVKIVDTCPPITGLHMHMHCMGYVRPNSFRVNINGGEPEVFDICGYTPQNGHFIWKCSTWERPENVQDFLITLQMSGKSVDSVRQRFTLKRKGNGLELLPYVEDASPNFKRGANKGEKTGLVRKLVAKLFKKVKSAKRTDNDGSIEQKKSELKPIAQSPPSS